MIATLTFPSHPAWVGDARIYQLDEPYLDHDYLAVTVFPITDGQWQNAGAQVVGCNETGHIPGDSVSPLWESYVVMTHDEVLAALGYQLADPGAMA